jgi:hypothetical protein
LKVFATDDKPDEIRTYCEQRLSMSANALRHSNASILINISTSTPRSRGRERKTLEALKEVTGNDVVPHVDFSSARIHISAWATLIVTSCSGVSKVA